MRISGWEKCSLIDFPGKIATVLFTPGCNFRCPFCHNGELWRGKPPPFIPATEIFDYLQRRQKSIDGVVISGGEPTLQPDLADFIRHIRQWNFAIKLDSNGSHPEVLEKLLAARLLDFVAMDIKSVFPHYETVCGTAVCLDAIKKSMELLRQSDIDYEFRTTVVPGLHSPEDLRALADLVRGSRRFALQNFVPDHAAAPEFRQQKPFDPQKLEEFRPIFEPLVDHFTIR